MLKHMRKSAASGVMKVVVFGLLMMGAVGLAFTGGSSFFSGGMIGDTAVASIGSMKIDATAFDRVVRQNVTQRGLDTRTAFKLGYLNQLLEQQIAVNVMNRGSRDLGLSVGDDAVQARTRRMLAPYATDGVTMKEAAGRIMRSQGLSESQFVETMRNDIMTSVVRGALADGTAVGSDSEAADLALFANEKRTVEIAFLPDGSIKNYKTPDDAVLKPFYQAGQERYAVPETRIFTLAVLTDKALDEKSASDADLRKMYEDQKASFSLPERRTVEQGILETREQAESVAAAVKGGKSLKEAVKESAGAQKTFTASQDYQRDGLKKDLGDAVFSARKGDVTAPVQSPLGWHVFTVKNILPPEVQSFESVKEKLRAAAANDRAGEALYNISTQLDDQLAGGGSLDEAAKTYRLDLVKIGPVHADGSTPDKTDGLKDFAKDSAVILKTAFGLSDGETSSVIGLSGGRYAAIRLDGVKAKSYKPFDEVKGELAKLWIADQQDILNKDRAKDALEKLKDGKTTLSAVAQSSGGTLKTLELDRLTTAVPEPLTPQSKQSLFAAVKGDYIGAGAKGGLIVGHVTAVSLPDIAKIAPDKIKAVREASLDGMKEEILNVYLTRMRDRYKVKVNNDLLKTMYDRNSSNGPDPSDPNTDQ